MTFADDMARAQKGIEKDLGLAYTAFVLLLGNEMAVGGKYSPGTPVRTGFARGNWTANVGSEPAPGLDMPQRGASTKQVGKRRANRLGQETVAYMQQAFGTVGLAQWGQPIYLMNHTRYIVKLEFGSSKQAPHGFMRLALANVQNLMNDIVRFLARGYAI